MIEININNGGILRLSQTEQDKMRAGVALEYLDSKGDVTSRELIDENDIVMLVNYYHYIKENDIQNDYINPNGYNDEKTVKDPLMEI